MMVVNDPLFIYQISDFVETVYKVSLEVPRHFLASELSSSESLPHKHVFSQSIKRAMNFSIRDMKKCIGDHLSAMPFVFRFNRS